MSTIAIRPHTDSYQSLANLSYIEPTYTTFHYLHNDPTPSAGDTDAQSPLPMDTTAPTATTLYNYDQNYDSDAGRLLQKTPQGLSTTQLQKHQVWRSGQLASSLSLSGDIKLDFWSATKDFSLDKRGVVTVYLRDYNGSTHTEIGNGTAYVEDWQGGSGTWVKHSILFPDISYTIPANNELEIFMVVENDADGDMWIAYDTTSYASVLKIP